MIPWKLLDSAPVPASDAVLRLYQRGAEFSIRVDSRELMNSRVHGSEDKLAELACARIADRRRPRLLIGGLGMGYTLAAALHRLGPGAQVVVAELVPAVVAWNRGPLAHLAGRPLQDHRVTVREVDVIRSLEEGPQCYDAVVLDVDNGPASLTVQSNDRLYARAGLDAACAALRPKGVLAIWSVGPDRPFTQRLRRVGFAVNEVRVPARGARGGRPFTLWIAECRR